MVYPFEYYTKELSELCDMVRELIPKSGYAECEVKISAAMQKYPHAPHPHNLYGLVLEAMDKHPEAMNHFRAALSLDATYKPARHNLHHFGMFGSTAKWAYDETDCCDGTNAEALNVKKKNKQSIVTQLVSGL